MRKTPLPRLVFALVLLSMAGCGPGTPTPNPTPTLTPEPEPLYVALIWHQHQPRYFKDPETDLYIRPWVRLHATKDYVDMAATVEAYPDLHVTFNLTPSLLRQLEDIAAGARDLYWEMTEIPAEELTAEQQIFILRRFFDTNRGIVARFPRYQELLEQRGDDLSDAALEATAAAWSAQDFRDLQLLFNLAWIDPDWLAQDPLAALVHQERDYSEEDKALVLAEHLRLVREVIPIHRRLQEAGQIEVTTTPYAHPILPLLVNTNLARVARPEIDLPRQSFAYGADALAQVERGVELYQELFGRAPRGMWPAEGAVAQQIVSAISLNGIEWIASDEGVLAHSLDMPEFARDAYDTVQQADILYRPYDVSDGRNPPVAILFRDREISDRISFTYSGMEGTEAAQDVIDRLHAIRGRLEEEGATGPHLVSIILDGENAWEHYENDGKTFLNTFYRMLTEDPNLASITPSDFLERFPDHPQIEDLWAGSWINHDFRTWIGEEEENRAWEYLATTRGLVEEYIRGERQIDDDTLERVMEWIYAAEGSDWFWWYGSDQESGEDSIFDEQFRDTLRQVYDLLGEEQPIFLDVPIIPQTPQTPTASPLGLLEPTVDGSAGEGEWEPGGLYQAQQDEVFDALHYGFDAQTLYLRLDLQMTWAALTTAGGNPNARGYIGFYLTAPGGQTSNPFSHWGERETLLGFGATHLAEIAFAPNGEIENASLYAADGEGGWIDPQPLAQVAVEEEVLELALPFEQMAPQIDTGDRIHLRAIYSQGTTNSATDRAVLPQVGPAQLLVPDLGRTTTILTVSDPAGDDHGPGSYSYPLDGVFGAGCFDIVTFTVGYDEEHIVFRFVMAGPVENPWNSPNGLSVQTFDIYIDQDGPGGEGSRLLLPGRNAALPEGEGWDFAIWAEGWNSGIYRANPDGEPEQVDATFDVLADPAQQKVTIRVPRSVLGNNPEDWRYLAVVLGQEGFPSAGSWRVRDVEPQAQQWRFGGAPDDTNHTRIIDVAWPAGRAPSQEALLSDYPPSQEEDLSQLGPDDFANLSLLGVE